MAEPFDFGFTLATEDELKPVTQEKSYKDEMAARLDNVFNAILPLLQNLKQNPEKEYILWPDRLKKVEEFEDYLRKLYHGD